MVKKKTKVKNTKKNSVVLKKLNDSDSKSTSNSDSKIVLDSKSSSNIISQNSLKKQIDDKKAFVIIGIVLLIVVSLFYFLFFYSPYKYQFDMGGVAFYSNYYTPSELGALINSKERIFVSPALIENNASALVVNSLNLWQVVLIMNDIDAVQLVRAHDESNNLLYCYTNNGDPLVNDKLEVNECNEVINNNFVVFIESGRDRVVVEENSITVYSSGNMSSYVNFAIIKSIFPNAQEALDIVNEKIYSIN